MVHPVPDGLNDLWRREMRVRCRGARRLVLVIGEQFLHRPRRVSPLARRVISENIGHSAPADITGEHGLFVVRGLPVFGFKCLQEADRRDIVAGLLLKAALSDPVRSGYVEVAGGFWLWLDVEDFSGERISPISIFCAR